MRSHQGANMPAGETGPFPICPESDRSIHPVSGRSCLRSGCTRPRACRRAGQGASRGQIDGSATKLAGVCRESPAQARAHCRICVRHDGGKRAPGSTELLRDPEGLAAGRPRLRRGRPECAFKVDEAQQQLQRVHVHETAIGGRRPGSGMTKRRLGLRGRATDRLGQPASPSHHVTTGSSFGSHPLRDSIRANIMRTATGGPCRDQVRAYWASSCV